MLVAQKNLHLIILLFLCTIVALAGLHGAQFGLSSHGDSRAIVEKSIPVILHGGYAPSRTFGNPLYEVLCAAAYLVTGTLKAANYLSILFAIGSLLIFDRLLDPAIGNTRRVFLLSGFALHPLFLINASTMAEWMLTLMLGLCLLYFAKRYCSAPGPRDLAACSFFAILSILTRPDMLFFCLTVYAASLWQSRFEMRAIFRLSLCYGAAVAVSALILVAINHGIGFIAAGYYHEPESLGARAARAMVSIAIVFGLFGVILPLRSFILIVSRIARRLGEVSLDEKIFFVTAIILTARFVLLPVKLEYIMLLPALTLLSVQRQAVSNRLIGFFVALVAIQNLVSVSLVDSIPEKPRRHFAVHLNRGALVQDWASMKYRSLVQDPAFLGKVADAAYGDAVKPRVFGANYAHALWSDRGDLLLGQLDAPSHFDLEYRNRLSVIYTCDRTMNDFEPGWRVLRREARVPAFNPSTGGLDVHCRKTN